MCACNLWCNEKKTSRKSYHRVSLKRCTFTRVFGPWFQRTGHMVQSWGTRWHQGNHMWAEQIHALNNSICGKRNKNCTYFASSAPTITETLISRSCWAVENITKQKTEDYFCTSSSSHRDIKVLLRCHRDLSRESKQARFLLRERPLCF